MLFANYQSPSQWSKNDKNKKWEERKNRNLLILLYSNIMTFFKQKAIPSFLNDINFREFQTTLEEFKFLGLFFFVLVFFFFNKLLVCNDFCIKPAFMLAGNQTVCWSLTHSSPFSFWLQNILSWSSQGHDRAFDDTEHYMSLSSHDGFGALFYFIG